MRLLGLVVLTSAAIVVIAVEAAGLIIGAAVMAVVAREG